MDDIAIKAENISKSFKLPHEKYSSLKSLFVNFYRRKKTYEMQHALKNISFEIKKGEFFGIVGRNGSGKSTLLKLLAGIYTPTKGEVHVRGKLTPFIELGVGFNPELTGRENVFLNGALLGFNRKEVHAMYRDIVDFAELDKFMDQKLKNYSSGMQVRLAFSIAIRAKSDILLIDEVLAVGDASFQKKCIKVFEELKRAGKTIVFVSHSMSSVKDFCDRVLVLNEGEVIFDGNTAKAVDIYNKINIDKDIELSENYNMKKTEHLGSGAARIVKYEFLDKEGNKTRGLETGKEFSIKINIEYKSDIKNPAVGVMFKKNPQENLYGINNFYEKVNFGAKSPGDRSVVTMTDKMPLNPGDYFITLSLVDAKSATDYEELDIMDNAARITVFAESEKWGIVSNSAKITEK